ncbi:MAG: M20/M25/M40 family metallo-hydrolase [Firmicutes bacterium]|nr:M20/M25/M40 family metallo-hydrolase [Bacillota bacterium]
MDILKTLDKMNAAFGPSGQESSVAAVIEEMAKPFCDEIRTDVMGNLICHKKGPGKKIMFAAHMDSIGMMVTHIEKEGWLRFGKIGWIPEKEVVGTPVKFANGVKGVVYCNEMEDEGKVKPEDLYIDIGANSAEEAKTHVRPGDMCVYDTRSAMAMNNCIISSYTDNRSGCCVLLMTMELLKKSVNDLYFVFTTQEEVGLRGARTAAFGIAPDYAIAVDVTGADNVPKSTHACSSSVGKGAAIKVKDSSVICSPAVNAILVELAEKKKIAYQMDVLTGGGTDAGPMHVNMDGVPTSGVSIPCKFCHCPQEMVSADDMESCAKLCAAFAEYKF